jgi:hypothetical protein
MAESKSDEDESKISRDRLAELLNEDLAREYQAIIAYVVYSQVVCTENLNPNIVVMKPAEDRM